MGANSPRLINTRSSDYQTTVLGQIFRPADALRQGKVYPDIEKRALDTRKSLKEFKHSGVGENLMIYRYGGPLSSVISKQRTRGDILMRYHLVKGNADLQWKVLRS